MSTREIALAIHIVAISCWVGGMILLAALVPALRRAIEDPEPRRKVVTVAAQRFNVVAWSGLLVAVFTGIWMLLLLEFDFSGGFGRRFAEKLVLVVISAAAAAVHAFWIGPRIRVLSEEAPDRADKLRMWSGITGALALVFAVAAVFAAVRLLPG